MAREGDIKREYLLRYKNTKAIKQYTRRGYMVGSETNVEECARNYKSYLF